MDKDIKKSKRFSAMVAIVVALAVFSACMLGGMVAMSIANTKNKRTIENFYSSAAYVLYDSLNNLEVGLSKLMISPDAAQNLQILIDCYRQAEIAETALSSLPIQIDSEQTNKIINQIGDYAKAYAAALARHKPCHKFEQSAKDFYDCSISLKEGAAEILAQLQTGKKITHMSKIDKKIDANSEKTHHSVEYPELIYDGPFSDGKQAKHYKLLQNAVEISQEDAIKVIKDKVSGMQNSQIVCVGVSQSDEPCYQFTANLGGSEAYFSVTVKGGLLVNYSINREFKKGKLSEESVKEIAQDAALALGYNAKSVWYCSSNNVAIVNLAPIIDGIIFYPDLVKVKVALDDGSVVGIEASGYCLNSCVRTLRPTMTAKAAESMVSSKLAIEQTRLAVIPLGDNEILCYEVYAKYNGLDYFVYIDAHKGEEVKILRIVDGYQGKLLV